MSASHNTDPRHVHILVTHALCDSGGSSRITVTVDPRIGLDVCISTSGCGTDTTPPIHTGDTQAARSVPPEALYLYVQ